MALRDGTISPGTKDVVVEQDEKGDLVESSDVSRCQERSESLVVAHFSPAEQRKECCVTSPRRSV